MIYHIYVLCIYIYDTYMYIHIIYTYIYICMHLPQNSEISSDASVPDMPLSPATSSATLWAVWSASYCVMPPSCGEARVHRSKWG